MSRLELGQIFDRSDDDATGHGSGGLALRHGKPDKPIQSSVIRRSFR